MHCQNREKINSNNLMWVWDNSNDNKIVYWEGWPSIRITMIKIFYHKLIITTKKIMVELSIAIKTNDNNIHNASMISSTMINCYQQQQTKQRQQ